MNAQQPASPMFKRFHSPAIFPVAQATLVASNREDLPDQKSNINNPKSPLPPFQSSILPLFHRRIVPRKNENSKNN